jgi:AraC-like DNA-binding protein
LAAGETVGLVLVGGAISALACTALAVGRSKASFAIRLSLALTCLSAGCYVAMFAPSLREAVTASVALWLGFVAVICAGMGFFWQVLGVALLGKPLSAVSFAPAGAMALLGVAGLSVERPLSAVLVALYYAACLGLVGHRLVQLAARWRKELVAIVRRTDRHSRAAPVALMAFLIGGYLAADVAASALWRAGIVETNLPGVRLAVLAGLAVMSALVLLESRRAAFVPAGRSQSEPDTSRDDGLQQRLEQAMGSGRLWAEEGLTLEKLARALAAPEYKVRQIIRERYGSPHFAQFINARRIAFVKEQLADPGARVADIAFEAGFASLSVFNRAFREETGMTPSAWRKARLLTDS